jgi:peptide/nickel transport system permease protein
MLSYILQRLLWAVPTLIGISMLSFVVMQLPPGDFLTSYAALLAQQGEGIGAEQLDRLREAYGLDQPIYVQYWKWISGIVFRGDFGVSMEWRLPVADLIWDRMAWTVFLAFLTIMVGYVLAIPIGVYSATHQYSKLDHLINAWGFMGLGIPNFTMALAVMWVAFAYFGYDLSGLFSDETKNAPWSFAKVWSMIGHLWLPILTLAWNEVAVLQRTMRANLLDELHKPYVTSARAGGLSENMLVWEYPTRVALNPFVSALGFALPELVSSATIVSIVLSLPMNGPLFLRALLSQDMYLAGAFVLMIGALTIVGMLISDILLAWLDPRIRYAT